MASDEELERNYSTPGFPTARQTSGRSSGDPVDSIVKRRKRNFKQIHSTFPAQHSSDDMEIDSAPASVKVPEPGRFRFISEAFEDIFPSRVSGVSVVGRPKSSPSILDPSSPSPITLTGGRTTAPDDPVELQHTDGRDSSQQHGSSSILNHRRPLGLAVVPSLRAAIPDVRIHHGIHDEPGFAAVPGQQNPSLSQTDAIADKTVVNYALQEHEALIQLDYEPTPAMEELVALLKALERATLKMVRNKHKIYTILLRSRDICNYIYTLSSADWPAGLDGVEIGPELVLVAMEESYRLISALEETLLELAAFLRVELEAFGPAMLSSWSQNRTTLFTVWGSLRGASFEAIPLHPDVEFVESSYFDDCAWLSRLLHDGIEAEVGLQFSADEETPQSVLSVVQGFTYLENAIKCQSPGEMLTDIAIDMATVLVRTLFAVTSPEEGTEFHQDESHSPEVENRDQLFITLADIFSPLNQEASLTSSEILLMNTKWCTRTSTSGRGKPQPPVSGYGSERTRTSTSTSRREKPWKPNPPVIDYGDSMHSWGSEIRGRAVDSPPTDEGRAQGTMDFTPPPPPPHPNPPAPAQPAALLAPEEVN